MKALICGMCMDIRALDPSCAWTTCRCGNVQARWDNPHRGTVKVRAADRLSARILGVNNNFFMQGVEGLPTEMITQAGGTSAAWRALHEKATNAPGYIFDKSHRGCWACIFKVGDTGDVSWEESTST